MLELRKAFESGRRVGDEDPEIELQNGESITPRRDTVRIKAGIIFYPVVTTAEGTEVSFKIRVTSYHTTRLAGDRTAIRSGLYRKIRTLAEREYQNAMPDSERNFSNLRIDYNALRSNSEMVTDMRVAPSLENPDSPALYVEIQNAEGSKVIVFAQQDKIITRVKWDDSVKIDKKLYEKLLKVAVKELRRLGVAA